ncbi:MAG: hypothetical protein EOM76_08930 [Sphingobacteriia bacterium]|nr:hypothetical protein [Sphingobacteriia bacterium]
MEKQITDISINGKTWYDKRYGNTYSSSQTVVYYNDDSHVISAVSFRYGDCFIQFALQELINKGILPAGTTNLYQCAVLGIKTVTYSQTATKKECKAYGILR